MLALSKDKSSQRNRVKLTLPELERFRQLIQFSPDLIAIHTRGTITYINPAGARILGYKSAPDVIGRPISDFLHPDDRRHVVRMFTELYERGEKHRSFQFRFMRADGKVIYLDVSSAPVSRKDRFSRQVVARNITERVNQEESFRSSEERFRIFVEGVKEYAMYTLDKHGNVTSWNRGAMRLYGYNRKEIIGKNFGAFFIPEQVSSDMPSRLLRSAERIGEIEEEGWRVRKDGSWFWAGILITAMRDGDGTLIGYSKISRDLTERKETEDRLIRELQQFKDVFDNSHAMMFMKDLRGRYVRVNAKFEQSFGIRAKDILGKTDAEIFPKEQADEYVAHDREVLRTGIPLVFEESALYKKGRHFSLVVKYPLRDDKREIYAIGGVVTDITYLKETEQLLRSANQRLNAILDSAPLAILTIGRGGIVLTWNRGAEQTFGWTEEEVRGGICPTVPSSDLANYMAMVEKGLKGESSAGHVAKRLRKDGTVIDAIIAYAPVVNADGRTESVTFVLQDITRTKQTERELESSNERLKVLSRGLESMREDEKKRIALEIHDQLGQMLTVLKMDINLIHEELMSGRSANLSEVSNQLTSSVGLIDDAIDTVRKIAADLRPPLLDHVGLDAAISELAASFERKTGISTVARVKLDGYTIGHAKSIAVYRVIQESLTNVARHSGATKVTIRSSFKLGELIVEVHDNGKGIVENEISGSSSFGIFGMHQRAESVGGSVTIGKSELGGTLVRLSLPLSRNIA